MLKVTIRAREKLKESLLEEQTGSLRETYRITPIPSMPNRLGIALDREKRGDQVIKSRDGLTVLLVQAELAEELEGMVLDYRDTPHGKAFTLNRASRKTVLGKKRWN